jgi:hypothetical protein
MTSRFRGNEVDELKKAIQAAGEELRDTYGWDLDDDLSKPVIETLFAQVLLKHVAPLIDPAAAEVARKIRVASLRAELAALGEPI